MNKRVIIILSYLFISLIVGGIGFSVYLWWNDRVDMIEESQELKIKIMGGEETHRFTSPSIFVPPDHDTGIGCDGRKISFIIRGEEISSILIRDFIVILDFYLRILYNISGGK